VKKMFLADFMLGRLARWLRVLGYDTIYSRKGIDSVLVVNAYREDRIILTRNTRLFKRIDPARALFIHYDGFRDQVREVIESLDLDYDTGLFLSRCLDCNLALVPLAREEVQTKVPPYIFQTIKEFRTCPQCGRIFWSGTHIEEMRKLIETFWVRKDIKNEDRKRRSDEGP